MSVRKDKYTWLLVIGVVLLIAASVVGLVMMSVTPQVTVHAGDGVFTARVVESEADLQKGLSGTSELSETSAMLFVFPYDGLHAIHMKDMAFSIDIVWLDSEKEVVHIVRNASPDSFPDTFETEKPARYVLEFPAGTVAKKNINVGSEVKFDLSEAERMKWSSV